MRVVLDTNILISAVFWRGPPYKVVLNAIKGKYSLYLSHQILDEMEEKLRVKFKFPEEKIQIHIEILRAYGKIIKPTIKLKVVKNDPDDNKVLECAVSSGARYIVSGDRHLLDLAEYKGIKIITAKEFLGVIGNSTK